MARVAWIGLGAMGARMARRTAALDHIPSRHGKPESAAVIGAVTTTNAPQYSWGDGCDGWRLVDTTGLSVIEERMPPDTAEEWHAHERARQFFYVLDGQATMRTPAGEVVVHAGAGVLVAPGTPHQMANTSGRDLRFLVISGPTTRGDRRPCPEPLQIGKQA